MKCTAAVGRTTEAHHTWCQVLKQRSKESESTVVGGDLGLVQGNSWDEASGLQQVKPGERGAFRSVGFRQSPETFGEQKEVESRQQSATEAAESAVCEQRGGKVRSCLLFQLLL